MWNIDIEIWFRQNYINYILNNDKITIFRPNNRFYPNPKSFSIGMIERAIVIEVPWNDIEWTRPKFVPNIVKFLKSNQWKYFYFLTN